MATNADNISTGTSFHHLGIISSKDGGDENSNEEDGIADSGYIGN